MGFSRLRRGASIAIAALAVAAPAASADPIEILLEGEPAPRRAVIPCYVGGPSVFRASSDILGSTAWIRCVGSNHVSVTVTWMRSGVQVSRNQGVGTNSATTTAGARCVRGGLYQPIATVYATAPNAVPASRVIRGIAGYYCGRPV
jgi:hypothetical protein